MVEWKEIRDLFDIRNGYTPSTKDDSFWTGGSIPWFKMEDIRSKGSILSDSILHITKKAIKGKGLFKANSILLATSATIGEHALITVEHLSNQRFTNLYPKEGYAELVDNKFLYYYMYKVDEWCKQHIHQGGFASVDMEGFYKVQIPIPSLPEQKRIVGILDTFTASIENLKEQIAQRRKQYEYYRDQLLDLEGKRGVVMRSLEDVLISLKTGLNPRKNFVLNTPDSNIPYITGKDIFNNKINVTEITDKINGAALKLINKRACLERGLILFASTGTGTVGRMAIIEEYNNDWGMSETLYGIKLKQIVIPKFIMYCLYSTPVRKQYEPKISKGSVPHLKVADLLNVSVPLISLKEQSRIVSILDTFEASIQNLESQLSQREKQYEYYRNKLLTFD